jgi:hypothetical protein
VEIESLKNRYLDLLNVKYVISGVSLNPLEKGMFDLNGKAVTPESYAWGGMSKKFFSLNTNTTSSTDLVDTASCDYAVPREGAVLHFTIGTDPSQWSGEGDGVEFFVLADDDGRRAVLFQRYINPKENREHRRWFNQEIDLTPYRNKSIKIIFTIKPGPQDNNAYDRGGFADIEIVPRNHGNQKLRLVYDKEVKIYHNSSVMPRAFIVHQAEIISQRDMIFARLKDKHFDFRNSIIIEKDPPEKMPPRNQSPLYDQSSVKILDYQPNRITLEATMENEGFLVLSDTYYPGWKAYANDRELEIYPADYMLRSIYLDKGSYQVRFVYDPLPLKIGLGISLLTLLGTGAFLCYKQSH